MGGSAKKQTNNMIQQSYNSANQGFGAAQNRANQMYTPTINTYTGMMEGGGMDPALRARYLELSKGGGEYGSGAPNMAGYGEVEKLYRDFSGGGGIDADKIREAMAVFKDQINNQDIAARMRGGGVYDEFSRTGGVSDAERGNLRARGASGVSSSFGRMKDEIGRTAAVQGGGVNPAMQARLARDQARVAGDTARETELGISDRERAGRQWGAQGMTESEKALQSLRGAAGSSWTSGESGIQDMIQRGKMFGTQGLEGVAGARARASQAGWGAGDELGALKWLSNFEADNRLGAASGMNSLLGNRPGEVSMYGGMRSDAINQRMQNNPNRDILGSIAQIAGGVGGAMTGFGNMGFGAPRRTPSPYSGPVS